MPVPTSEQVLVKVFASGLNRGEITMASRHLDGNPLATGVEFAGEVVQVGAAVSGWYVGDAVMGHGSATQAEYVLAAPQALMRKPAQLDWVHAAAFPNVFMTAHDALISNGALQPGESVLVNAASSGIGLAALQIARLMGAGMVVATTRSASKAERLSAIGVDRVINTSVEDQEIVVNDLTGKRGVNIIIDSVGAPVFEANLRCLAVLGRLVNIGRMGGSKTNFDLDQLWLKRLKLVGVTFRTRSEAERVAVVQACARDLLGFLEQGKIQLPIDRVFGMAEIAQAYEYMGTDQHFGKIVLTI